jgi:hypothetical protein
MKTSPVVALTLSAAFVTTPTIANAKISGVGEFWIADSFLSSDIDDDSYRGLGGNFRLNVPVADEWTAQFDLGSEAAFVDNSENNYTGSVLGGAHVSYRAPKDWLLGGFVGVGNGSTAGTDTATAWLLGAEAQYYMTEWTFYGQLGYMDAEDTSGGASNAFRSAWFGRGVGRFFLDATSKLEGELSYANGENDTDADDMDVWGWGLRYERAVKSMDANIFLAYQGNYYDSTDPGPGDDNELTEHTIKLGLNVAFGIEGQKSIDRSGATLDLPMVTRWAAHGAGALD